MNRNAIAAISHNEYKAHRIGSYGINKISLLCVDDKMYIKNNGYDELALGY